MLLKKIFKSIVFIASLLGLFFVFPVFAQQDYQILGFPSLYQKKLNRNVLDASLSLGTKYLVANQRSQGHFNYEYNFLRRAKIKGDSQVRQAGALWGLALIHQDHPSEETGSAIQKGLAFFDKYSREKDDGRKYIVYPFARSGNTGTVALVTLALADYLRSEEEIPNRQQYEDDLSKYIQFLLSVRMKDGHFYRDYNLTDGNGYGPSSPYYDGEALLALVKAAKYAGRDDLQKRILISAEEMYKNYIKEALEKDPDSKTTKGFYQWGSMAYYEIFTSDWTGVEKYAQRVIDLAYWMIDVHQTLSRVKNTAYAYEGLVSAWEIARLTNDQKAMDKISQVVDEGLFKLTSWQIGGPLQNMYLLKRKTNDPLAVGGVMNAKDDPVLRIDVTQHQMHALILARRFIYKDTMPIDSRSESEVQQKQKLKYWFDDIKKPIILQTSDLRALSQYLFGSLTTGKNAEMRFSEILTKDSRACIVFLSVSDGIAPAHTFMGTGKGVIGAFNEALKSARRFLSSTDFKPLWIKADIVQQVKSLGKVDFKKPLVIEMGLDGIAFDENSQIAFLPAELLAHNLVNSNRVMRGSSMDQYLIRKSQHGGRIKRVRDIKEKKMNRFTTESFFSDGKDFYPLYRGHRGFDEITQENLLSSSRLAGDYLIRAVDPNGKFTYEYIADTDTIPSKYNILRHAGSVYSMLELYEFTEDQDLLEATQSAIKYLIDQMKPLKKDKEKMLCLVEKGYVKLGGNALAIVALAKYTQVTGDKQYVATMKKLGKWIQSVQNDRGEFVIHKQVFPFGKIEDFTSQYYPGEAILAMARLHTLDPQGQWLKTAEAGSRYLINVRDKDVANKLLNHDHWLLYGLNELYRNNPDQVYLDHAMRITQSILDKQNLKPKFSDWLGSFYIPPRATPSATRSEGLLAAYQLTRDFGDPQKAVEILEAIKRAISFQLQMQFRPESVLYMRNPRRALGGIHGSLTSFDIRIDYVQHNISAFLGLYALLQEQ